MLQKTLFLWGAPTLITIFLLVSKSSLSRKQKVHQFSKSLRRVSSFYFIWVLLKFIFTLREYQKSVNLLKKEKNFFNWGSLYARLNSHYKAWSYKKRLKHEKIKASKKFY